MKNNIKNAKKSQFSSKIINFLLIFVLLISCLLFIGCENKDDNKLTICTSFYPIYDFTTKLTNGTANVYNLTPAGTEPHDYEPTMQDIQNMYNADLIIVNGLGLENWTSDLPDELQCKILVASSGITATVIDGVTDPHVWLNVKYAIKEMENIKNKLCLIDNSNANIYINNYEKQKVLFNGLDSEIRTELSALENNTIVVSHRAFGYFCDEYNLTQIYISGLSPDDEPTLKDVQNIVNVVNETGITTIFYEEMVSSTIAEQIATATGASVSVLSPLEGLKVSDLPFEDYLTVMSQNLVNLVKALS